MKIIINRAKCLKCGEVIKSAHRHDFNWCKCGAIAVDGGTAYNKRTGEISNCEEACVYDATSPTREGNYHMKWIIWSPEGKTNPSTVFDRHEDALLTAKSMRDKYGGCWYVSMCQTVP